jgi:hypothetical protein
MQPEDQTLIGCLRVQHARQDRSEATATKLRVGRLLASANVRPPGFPPSAVLIVQRMADPLPGRLASRQHALLADTTWQAAAQRELEERFRDAAQPIRGFVPATATAVRFADESELMACLARDIGRGRAGQHWWWRVLLHSAWSPGAASAAGDPRVDVLVQRLARQAHLAPATLARLHDWGEAIAVLRLFTSTQAAQVLHALLLAYRLPGLPASPPHPWRARPHPPPWAAPNATVPVLPTSLGPERMALLGLALDLNARPQVAASDSYQRRLHAWWQTARLSAGAIRRAEDEKEAGETGNRTELPSPAPPAPEIAAGRRSDREPAELTAPLLGAGEAGAAAAVAAPMSVHPAQPAPTAAPGRRVVAPGSDPGRARSGESFSPPSGSPDHQTNAKGERASPVVETASEPAPSGGRMAADEPGVASELPDSEYSLLSAASVLALCEGVPTEFGGVLYLINLMVALDLPACCEVGWRLASGVGPWGLLHALGRELLPDGAAAPGDPLWLALAHLDGRSPGQPPGAHLPRSRPRRWPPFELPASWLAHWPTHLPIYQPSKTPALSPARHQVAALRTRYPPLLARWLALALPFIELRLRLALGLTSEGHSRVADVLLRLPGHLYVTRTHVDLVASLEHIALPVRLAGLDRTPGWLPDFARVVTFHFE